MRVINCPQCGGTTQINDGEVYAECPFCNSKYYFKDNEIYLLNSVINQKEQIIQNDINGTKNVLKAKFVFRLMVLINSILYFISALTLPLTQYDNKISVYIWFVGFWWVFGSAIGVYNTHQGYNVYKNEYSNKNKIKACIKFLIICKLFCYISWIIGVIIAYVLNK